MTPVVRRSFLLAVLAGPVVGTAFQALALDALPDAPFVGYAQQVNDFEIGAGRLALTKSTNENVRGFATRMVADYNDAAQKLARARSEAGVSYAPDPAAPSNTRTMLQRLSLLEGADFDAAYASMQVTVLSGAEQQYAANSNSQATNAGSASSGAMMRFARSEFPRVKQHREMAQALAAGR